MSDAGWRPVRQPGERRVMARPAHHAAPARSSHGRGGATVPGRPRLAALLALAAVALVSATLLWLPGSNARPLPTPSAPARASAQSTLPADVAAAATVTPQPSRPPARAGSSAPIRTPRSTPETRTHTPRPTDTPAPAATRHPDAAPASADEFDLQAQVIAIAFPLKERHQYRYRNNFGNPREGHAEHYNHARARSGRQILRAHDGIDIYAATGTPVVAPFDGVVIDPAARWQPWIERRYGRTAAIVSSEPLSEGYAALLTHLDAVYVEPGQRVQRGEVVGTVGDSGNAEGGRPHLHFELRAPFALSWQQVGEDRLVDAFNPYPSLRAADPKRSE